MMEKIGAGPERRGRVTDLKYADPSARTVFAGSGGTDAPIIYVIDLPYHPFDIEAVSRGCNATVVKIPVDDWDDSLTPWTAPGLYDGDADFGGEAHITLSEIIAEAIPEVERSEGFAPSKRAICGYSLGGLFALYAFTHADYFQACACLSGSVWYEGWPKYLGNLDFDANGRFAFLSIGSKEKRAPQKILHRVQDSMETCAEILREHGCQVEYSVGPGGHLDYGQERFSAGLAALDGFLAKR